MLGRVGVSVNQQGENVLRMRYGLRRDGSVSRFAPQKKREFLVELQNDGGNILNRRAW